MTLISIVKFEEEIETLVSLALRRELIPFFGAGFTAGCQSCEGVVPNAETAKETIRDLILKATSLFTRDELNELDFFALSECFFEYVSVEDRALYFDKNYTNVRLYPRQKEFLSNIDWPYAYTINIDDGIENNSDFTPVLPYRKLRRPQTSKRLLYKLHGDARHECTYDTQGDNIIFSQSQYVHAITDERNIDIYQMLRSDYGQRNLLFIGCSLQSEQDLTYVYGKSREFHQDTLRVVLREEEPSAIEQQKLKQHGINKIILVKDYEQFYSSFLSEYKRQQGLSHVLFYEHINPTVTMTQEYDASLSLLAGTNIFDNTKNQFTKSIFHILRYAVNSIAEGLKNNTCILLKGRRFSGKTYVLCSLAERYKTKTIFYFPSNTFIDEDVIESLLKNYQDGLFLFDSNSITPDVYGFLLHSSDLLEEKKHKIVIALNSKDNYMPTKITCEIVELKSQFNESSEIAQIHKALDSFGLIRRNPTQTNIDFLYALKREQKVTIPFDDKVRQSYTPSEKRILLALYALDKLYYSDLIALDFSRKEIEQICQKIEPLIELVQTSPTEATRHSKEKLVHNSKIALVEILQCFTINDITESILYIVKKFRTDYNRRRLYVEIILFDTLMQLFSKWKNTKELIAIIYEKLQPLLKDDLHYWLQRAKSIYRTSSSEKEFSEAYGYAKKAYLDGHRSLKSKAALTIALITCALSECEDVSLNDRIGYCEEAIVFAHEAVISDDFRLPSNYLQSEIPIGKNTSSERRITTACNCVLKYSKSEFAIRKSKEILNYFEYLRKRLVDNS